MTSKAQVTCKAIDHVSSPCLLLVVYCEFSGVKFCQEAAFSFCLIFKITCHADELITCFRTEI